MNLMGACRNCLAKWMCLEAWKARPGSKFKHLTYENAKLLVNGNTNIAKPKATAAQLVSCVATLCCSSCHGIQLKT